MSSVEITPAIDEMLVILLLKYSRKCCHVFLSNFGSWLESHRHAHIRFEKDMIPFHIEFIKLYISFQFPIK